MTTYEEDIADIYYNLQGYFTMMNIPFSATEKREGGKGRGEIDLLGVKIKDDKVKDIVHAEVSVSLVSKFPFTSRTQLSIDESGKIIKKFFQNDSEHKIKEIIGNFDFRRVIISSEFDSKSLDRLKERIPDFGGRILEMSNNDRKIRIKIKYEKKIISLEIIPFSVILSEVRRLFSEKGLNNKHFQDERYRAVQYLLNASKK